MKNVCAYLLLLLAEKTNITAADVTAVLSAGGVSFDQAVVESVVSKFAGKTLEEVIEAGRQRMSAFAVAAPSAGASAGAAVADVKEPEPEEEEEEEDEDLGLGLFD